MKQAHLLAEIERGKCTTFWGTGDNEAQALESARGMLNEGDRELTVVFENYYPESLRALVIMDNRRHDTRFNYTAGFNAFLRRNRDRIHGIKVIAGGNVRKVRAVMAMHGIKFI